MRLRLRLSEPSRQPEPLPDTEREAMKQDINDLKQEMAFLRALAPPWLVGFREAARAQGWTVHVESTRIMFRREEPADEFPVALPLPDPEGQQKIANDLRLRVSYHGPTGLPLPRVGEDRRRLLDMPLGRAFPQEDAA